MQLSRITSAFAVFASCLILFSTLDALHRSAHTVALLYPLLAVIAVLGVFSCRIRPLRATCAIAALFATISVGLTYLPQPAGTDLRVYSKNLWAGNTNLAANIADIKEADVDAVFLQELSDKNVHILTKLSDDFPHQHFCRFSGWSGIAVVSKHAFVEAGQCSDWRAMAAVPISMRGERIWLISAHIPWPWPHDSAQNEHAAQVLINGLDGKIVIAGDFNILPWTGRVRQIATLSDTKRAGPSVSTFTLAGLPLPIDLAFAPYGGSVHKRGKFGSDHAGILADLNLWAPDK